MGKYKIFLKAVYMIYFYSKRFRFAPSFNNILVVKAEDDKETFEKKFKLPFNVLVDKIESKFDVKEENTQTLAIHVLKDKKRTQVPTVVCKIV